jgi:ubiquinone/menaquinone biosynthesis C-methylase UbiE
MVQADKILQELWDKDVKAWDKWWVPIFRKFASDLVSGAKVRRGQIVLDVGTGTGVAAIEAAKRVRPGGIVFGIDRSSPIVKLAEATKPRVAARNLCYLVMDADHMLFQDEFFDGVVSNCGISYVNFPGTVCEVFRVLRKGGTFGLNDWHLIDVPAHRKFGEILQQYRTDRPSEKLQILRAALSTYEHTGNRYAAPRVVQDELKRAGFNETTLQIRNYRIRLHGVQQYLDLRLKRAALQQELVELSRLQRTRLLTELKSGLKSFERGGRFIMDWNVNFIRAKKLGRD